jgi:Flp pilus assembly protein TadG
MKNIRCQTESMVIRKREYGQAAVEFLLSVVFVVVLIVGFLEVIMLLYAYNVIADSAKEGVRYAIVHGTLSKKCNGPGDPLNALLTCDGGNAGTITALTSYANRSGQTVVPGDVTVTYTNPTGGALCSVPGCGVQVTISHSYRPFFGLGWPSVRLAAAAKGTVTF